MSQTAPQFETIKPVDYTPSGGQRGSGGWLRKLLLLLVFVVLLAVSAVATWLFTGQSVRVNVIPGAELVELEGTRWQLKLADRWLLHPGEYTVVASVEGYYPLREVISVNNDPEQTFEFTLEELPGLVSIQTEPAADEGRVLINGESLAELPDAMLELAGGDYRLTIDAPRFKPFGQQISVEGRGAEQLLTVELEPAWADIAVASEPAGATLLVDGEPFGVTPLTAEVVEGERELQLTLDGYESWFVDLSVIAGQPQDLATVALKKADYQVRVVSTPGGASVTVDGDYRGQTPLNLKLTPDQQYRVGVSKSGYRAARRDINVVAGQSNTVSIRMQPILGAVELAGTPADAEVLVDGVVRGLLNSTLQLPAHPHQILVRKPGYQDYQVTVTPNPTSPQRLAVSLLSTAQVREAAMPANRTAANGYPLNLLKPSGVIRMGSNRREQGRRANEAIRQAKLERPFYIGLREVTNDEFAQYRSEHRSGVAGRHTLSLKQQPVVRVTWQDAAEFCNWLSQRDGLPPAYERVGGRLQAVKPMTTGYRLPTEAEWVYVARYSGDADTTPKRFPWGDTMPPPPGTGNFAGTEAAGLVERSLASFTDEHPASSDVGRFPANSLGLVDLGGNVREWMHDFYALRGGTGRAPVDPTGPTDGEGHVVRGSSWRSGGLAELRLAHRGTSTAPQDDIGFRIARYAE